MATEVIQKWTFGEPNLKAVNNSDAVWSRGSLPAEFQKSPSGWLANLYGGVQTNDDFASLVIPVNELKVTSLRSANWTYYMTNAESAGVNIVVWVHDPTALQKRAEITQVMGLVSKASGWNVESLDLSATEMFYYGENTGTSTTTVTAGTNYTWAQFQADNIFSTWTIYRITFDYGWIASSTLDDAWLADVEINDKHIVLKPDSGGSGRIGHRTYYSTDTSATHTLKPKTPFRLLSINCEMDSAGTTDESLTITLDSIADSASGKVDTLLYSQNTKTPAVTSLYVPFGEGYDFEAGDELVMAWANSQARDFGWRWTYQTVF